jgi:RNA polymerase sigma factor (sigma-70 family)
MSRRSGIELDALDEYQKEAVISKAYVNGGLLEDDIRQEKMPLLAEAIKSLPDQTRRIVRMRLAEISYKEIAAELNMSVGAVKMAHVRAVDALGDLLGVES